jgi:hypothetical protein
MAAHRARGYERLRILANARDTVWCFHFLLPFLKRWRNFRIFARRRAQAPQRFLGVGLSRMVKFALDLAAFAFIAAVTLVVFGLGIAAYVTWTS